MARGREFEECGLDELELDREGTEAWLMTIGGATRGRGAMALVGSMKEQFSKIKKGLKVSKRGAGIFF